MDLITQNTETTEIKSKCDGAETKIRINFETEPTRGQSKSVNSTLRYVYILEKINTQNYKQLPCRPLGQYNYCFAGADEQS